MFGQYQFHFRRRLSRTGLVPMRRRLARFFLLIACGCAEDSTAPAASGPAIDSSATSLAVGTGVAHLVFLIEPTDTELNQPIATIRVGHVDESGNAMRDARESVTLLLTENPGDATLSGTTRATPVDGIATFGDVTIDRTGRGYVLKASSASLLGTVSDPFNITLTFARVTAGVEHTCGVTVAGDAYCWGSNERGELGNESNRDSHVPSLVGGGLKFSSTSAGDHFTCGVTSDAHGYCWGGGARGQLGIGYATAGEPQPVPLAIDDGVSFSVISAGGSHACGHTTVGSYYCWGDNSYSQVFGTCLTGNCRRLSPLPFITTNTDPPHPGFISLSAGTRHSCALRMDGEMTCWGSDDAEQLGNGPTGDPSNPGPVLVERTFRLLAEQSSFHSCGFGPGRAAFCWGANGDGQLGDGTTYDRFVPTQVGAPVAFTTITPGLRHTCALTGGQAYCWGDNSFGQLGDGTFTNRVTPAPIAGSLRFESIDAGGWHTCAVTGSGTVYCWGRNSRGQLGDGTAIIRRSTPTRVIP